MVATFLGLFLAELPTGIVVLLATILSLAILYITGTLASHVVGRRLIALGERIVAQIPVVKTIYAAAKQVIELVRGRPESANQQVILVDFPAPGMKAFGFLTGQITTSRRNKML